jgi:hypothetical protein
MSHDKTVRAVYRRALGQKLYAHSSRLRPDQTWMSVSPQLGYPSATKPTGRSVSGKLPELASSISRNEIPYATWLQGTNGRPP